MNKAWILAVLLHSCVTEQVKVRAYQSELECNKAMDKERFLQSWTTTVQAQCESVETMLEEQKP